MDREFLQILLTVLGAAIICSVAIVFWLIPIFVSRAKSFQTPFRISSSIGIFCTICYLWLGLAFRDDLSVLVPQIPLIIAGSFAVMVLTFVSIVQRQLYFRWLKQLAEGKAKTNVEK